MMMNVAFREHLGLHCKEQCFGGGNQLSKGNWDVGAALTELSAQFGYIMH